VTCPSNRGERSPSQSWQPAAPAHPSPPPPWVALPPVTRLAGRHGRRRGRGGVGCGGRLVAGGSAHQCRCTRWSGTLREIRPRGDAATSGDSKSPPARQGPAAVGGWHARPRAGGGAGGAGRWVRCWAGDGGQMGRAGGAGCGARAPLAAACSGTTQAALCRGASCRPGVQRRLGCARRDWGARHPAGPASVKVTGAQIRAGSAAGAPPRPALRCAAGQAPPPAPGWRAAAAQPPAPRPGPLAGGRGGARVPRAFHRG